MPTSQDGLSRDEAWKRGQRALAQVRAGIEGPLQERRFDNFDTGEPGSRQAQALGKAMSFFENRGKALAWLLFAGRTGTGKSHLALAIANEVIGETGRAPVCYTKMTKLMRRIRATYHRDAPETEQDVVRYYQRIGLLIIDEFGLREGLTEWERVTLDDILDFRWEQNKPTVIVTNMLANEFFRTVGDRVESRFADRGEIVNFIWGDYRIKRRKERGKKGAGDGKEQGQGQG